MMDRMQPVLFYSWQSDTLRSVNRGFIRDATDRALKAILADGEVQEAPRLDEATKGKGGTPEIAGTIFEKIGTADFFLGDVTLVGRIGKKKRAPNPNVSIELGYAAGILGWSRILLVMNTHYGAPENLPFDLKHRKFPITYSLARMAADGVKADIRKKLVREIRREIEMAKDEEHEQTDRILSQLSQDCIDLLRNLGRGANFHFAPRDPDKPKMPTAATVAVDRLLTVGLLCSVYQPEKGHCSHVWTYQGGLVLKKLGIDPGRPSLAKRLRNELGEDKT